MLATSRLVRQGARCTPLRCAPRNRLASAASLHARNLSVKTDDEFKAAAQKGMSREQSKYFERRLGIGLTGFPDFIEHWDQKKFYQFGYMATAGTVGLGSYLFFLGDYITAVAMGSVMSGYWVVGMNDIKQNSHAIRKNFPVLGNVRYILEVLRPEIRQYFVEGEQEATPFDRQMRSIAYQRAKNMPDTLPLGTRFNVYESGYEWANHSMFPKKVLLENSRVTIGGPDCLQPYSASLLNVSAMSYGALSDNAILALNTGARLGGFYHNTGEGGVSRFHKEPGGDIVWNIGTGYFGCRAKDGSFCPDMFVETVSNPNVKMVEIKLSQGAKPAHGGMLPKEKITPAIAEARGLGDGPYEDCNSPAQHSAFSDAEGLMHFVAKLRDLSGGKPVGFKMCVGRPSEVVALAQAMLNTGIKPDFITVDGAEGGTGAAPPEFSNRMGMPLFEGLTLIHSILRGADLRKDIKLICAGKILTGFSLVKALALGADVCNAARAMMFALGCIQALKCNTNTCPTGIATSDPEKMKGLHVPSKSVRVYNFHRKTVDSALEIIGACGLESPRELDPHHIMRRVSSTTVLTYDEQYPVLATGALLKDGPFNLHQKIDLSMDGRITYNEFKQYALNQREDTPSQQA